MELPHATTHREDSDRTRTYSARAVFLLLSTLTVLLVSALAGCGLQSGTDTIAFLQGKALWVVNPDGSNLRKVAQGNIVSMAWSPDHHQYVYRVAAQIAPPSPYSVLGVPDAPGDLEVSSVNGGSPIPITQSLAGLTRSDAWWNANGNRLIYRESLGGGPQTATYIVSQADQPAGIARKVVAENAILPVLSADGSQLASEDSIGDVHLGAPGETGRVIATGAIQTLPETDHPARLLWQPKHDALLYIASGAQSAATLELLPIGGKPHALGEVKSLLDLAFSPDGLRLLLRTTAGFAVWDVANPGHAVYSWTEDDPAALPYWSPAGGRILVQDSAGWQLVDIAAHSVDRIVTIRGAKPTDISGITGWHPAAGSPWNAAGNRFVFVGGAATHWQGKPLSTSSEGASGLYVADPASDAAPAHIDTGNDRAPQWTYLDPSTTFLMLA